MQNYKGFIPIDRFAYLDHKLFQCEKFDRGHAFLDLIILANHCDSFFFIAGTPIPVKKGEIARSQKQLAERWGWDVKTVNKFLKLLEKSRYIIHQSYPK